MHFTEVGRAVYVDKTGNVLVCEVPKQSNLAQNALRQRDFLQRASDHLDRDGFPRDLIRGGAMRVGRTKAVGGGRLRFGAWIRISKAST